MHSGQNKYSIGSTMPFHFHRIIPVRKLNSHYNNLYDISIGLLTSTYETTQTEESSMHILERIKK